MLGNTQKLAARLLVVSISLKLRGLSAAQHTTCDRLPDELSIPSRVHRQARPRRGAKGQLLHLVSIVKLLHAWTQILQLLKAKLKDREEKAHVDREPGRQWEGERRGRTEVRRRTRAKCAHTQRLSRHCTVRAVTRACACALRVADSHECMNV